MKQDDVYHRLSCFLRVGHKQRPRKKTSPAIQNITQELEKLRLTYIQLVLSTDYIFTTIVVII